ncbi:MAG: hypothetical protein V3V12_00890 [Gammaproteobacteria bacterium]
MRIIIIVASSLLLTSCNPIRGFLESEFKLSRESRLPIWFAELPDGYERDDVEVYLRYYTSPFDVKDTVLISKSMDGKTLTYKTGKMEHHPEYWKWATQDWPARAKPGYVNVTIDGLTEIIAHKKMEPIFYISNEQAVRDTMNLNE